MVLKKCFAMPRAALQSAGILLARCLRLLKLHSKADESKPIPACVLRSNTEQPLPPPATPYEHSWPDVAAMCTVEERSRLAQQDALKAQAAFVVHILRTGIASQRSAPIMGDLLQKFPANNFSVTDDLVVSQAAGIYPLGALLNHSCAPNCVITYEEGTHIQEIRTNCDVPAGTELTHSFVDVALPTLQRQAHLLSLYGFECRCARCAYSPALPAASAVQLPSCAVPTNIRATELALIATQTHQASHAPQGGSMAVIATSKPPEEEKALQAVDAALHQAAAAQSEQVELGILAAALHKACQVLHPLHAKLGQLHAAMQQVAMVTGDMAAAAQHAAFLAAQMRFTLSSHVGEPPSPGQMQQGDEPRPEKDAFISAVEGVITEQVRPFPPHQLMALQLGTVLELLHAAQPTEDAVQWSFEVPPGGEWLRTCLPDSVRGIFEANASVMQIVHGWQMLRRPDM